MWIWIYKLGLIRQILNRANVGIFPVRQLGIISLDKLSTDPIFRIQCQGKPFLSNQFLHNKRWFLVIFQNVCYWFYYILAEGPSVARGKKVLKKNNFEKKTFWNFL